MTSKDYSNRELDSHFVTVRDSLVRIETQVLKTNGRVNRLERNMLVLGCIVGTILIMKFPQVMEAVKFLI